MSLRAGRLTVFRTLMAISILLGVTFIGGQAWEYYGLISNDITIDENLFAATFFTVTGFHGLHVIAGIVALSVLLTLACKGYLTTQRSNVVRAVGVYWHFVDVVWVVVFCIIYLRFLQ
jgi:heme/copper-type cytochrome/quinol oxidase subunit 3